MVIECIFNRKMVKPKGIISVWCDLQLSGQEVDRDWNSEFQAILDKLVVIHTVFNFIGICITLQIVLNEDI